MIFLDFKKAFDGVSHNELLVKLWHFGITGDLWHWFRAYLTGRKQYVSINNCHSSLLPVISGAQQGSILGPLLFLVFINDLPDCVLNSSMSLFADDAKCSLPISRQCDCLLLFSMILMFWQCGQNTGTCSLMSLNVPFGLHASSSSHVYSINSCEIQSDSQHKDLGHILYVTTKAYKILGLLRRSFRNCNTVKMGSSI